MPDLKKRPTKEFIMETKGHLQGKWSDAHAGWRRRDAEYHRTFEVWDKKLQETRGPGIRSSIGTSKVNRAVDTQLSTTPVVHREGRFNAEGNQSDNDERKADGVEFAVRDIFIDSAKKESTNPWQRLGYYLIHYDYAILEAPILEGLEDGPRDPVRDDFDSDNLFKAAESQNRALKRNWNPIRFRAPHPATVLMDPEMKNPPIAIKTQVISAGRLEELTTRKAAKEYEGRTVHKVYKAEAGYYEEEKIVHFWSEFWHTVMLDKGALLYSERNLGGFLPFQHGFSGRGIETTDDTVSFALAMARGLLWPVEELIQMDSQQLDAKHTLTMNQAYPIPGTTQDPLDMAKQINRGGMVQGEKDDLWHEEPVPITNATFIAGQEIRERIDKGTYDDALGGFRPSGETTVGQAAIRSEAAERQFDGYAEQMAIMGSGAASNLLRLIESMSKNSRHDGVGVNGRRLTAAMINGDYNIEVNFKKPNVAMQIQEREMSLREYDARLISRRTYLKDARQMEDAVDEEDRRLKESVNDMPEVHELLALEAVQGEGTEEVAEAAFNLRQERTGEGVAGETDKVVNVTSNRANGALNSQTQNPNRV